MNHTEPYYLPDYTGLDGLPRSGGWFYVSTVTKVAVGPFTSKEAAKDERLAAMNRMRAKGLL